MSSAVITYCGHFFHGNCLRKWLYVQETCPMCHQKVRPPPPGDGAAAPDPEGEHNRGTQIDEGNLDPAEQGEGDDDQPPDPDCEATHNLSFSFSGEPGLSFVLPVSSGGPCCSQNQQGRTSPNYHSQFEVNATDSSQSSRTNIGTASQNKSASELSGFALPPNHDRTSEPTYSLLSQEGNNSDDYQKPASGDGSPVGNQTSCESWKQESPDSVNSHHGLSTYSDFSQGEPVPQILQASPSVAAVTECSPSVT